MTSQYLGSVVNMDELSINHFDADWKAEIEALVSYNEKIKYTGEKIMRTIPTRPSANIRLNMTRIQKNGSWMMRQTPKRMDQKAVHGRTKKN